MACRTDPRARPHPHACSTWHRQLVDSYRDARLAYEAAREAATNGYAAEFAAFDQGAAHPVTFRSWLEGMRGHQAA